MPYLLRSSDADVPHACLLFKGLYTGFTIITLRCYRWHVGPVEEAEDFGHGFGLVKVRGHRTGEIIIAGLVTELGTGRRIAYLRDLKKPKKIGNLEKNEVKSDNNHSFQTFTFNHSFNFCWQPGFQEVKAIFGNNLKKPIFHIHLSSEYHCKSVVLI